MVFAVLIFSVPAWGEEPFRQAFTPAFRLTCLPGQNFAVLESLWLERLPRDDMAAFTHDLAAKGVYFPSPLRKVGEQTPLAAHCLVEGHTVAVAMLGRGDITEAAVAANGRKPFAFQDCERVMNLALQSLKVDGHPWYSDAGFANACLDSNIVRMRIYPAEKRLQVCTQAVGGMLEDGLPDVWYGDLPVDAAVRENPPTPQVTCKTVNLPLRQ